MKSIQEKKQTCVVAGGKGRKKNLMALIRRFSLVEKKERRRTHISEGQHSSTKGD